MRRIEVSRNSFYLEKEGNKKTAVKAVFLLTIFQIQMLISKY